MVEKERIITGTLEGIPFKCKNDRLNLSGGYFIDLKTMESLQSEKYSTTLHRYTKSLLYNIVEYQYTLQMYVYQELLKQTYGYEFTPYIMAVSKEPVPDKELILIDDTSSTDMLKHLKMLWHISLSKDVGTVITV